MPDDFIDGDTTFANLISTGNGTLEEGNHDLQVQSIDVGLDDIGTVDLTWEFSLTVAEAMAPVEPTTWARIKRLYAVETASGP